MIDFKELALAVVGWQSKCHTWSSRPGKRPREELTLLAKSRGLVLSKIPSLLRKGQSFIFVTPSVGWVSPPALQEVSALLKVH